jgi:hypothetical protein
MHQTCVLPRATSEYAGWRLRRFRSNSPGLALSSKRCLCGASMGGEGINPMASAEGTRHSAAHWQPERQPVRPSYRIRIPLPGRSPKSSRRGWGATLFPSSKFSSNQDGSSKVLNQGSRRWEI